MTSLFLYRRCGLHAAAIACLLAAAPAASQEQTEEDKQKLEAFLKFQANLPSFLPTVNLINAEALPITFPFRMVGEQIVVDVDFGDGVARPFMLDTGAPTFVTEEIGDEHGGETVIEMVTIAGGGVIEWSPMVKFPSVTIAGALEITDVTGGVNWATEGPFYCITRNGLIGSQAMRNAVWQIHYGNEEITVAATVDQLDHISDAIALPFTVKEDGLSPTPWVELGLGDGKLVFIVDTGGGVPLTINSEALAKVGLELPEDAPVAAGISSGAGGDFDTALAGFTAPMMFGDAELLTTAVVGDGLAPTTDGNMGASFLKNFIVTLDWSSQTMYLEPLFEGDRVPLPGAASVGVGFHGDDLAVTSIAKSGPADEAGLTLGEVVIAINGTDVTDISADAFCELKKTPFETVTTASDQSYDAGMIEGFFDTQE
ncbi:hypothetical protein XM53_06640 [Roseovarius atlanticus]|uniref:PDZ domain-containing protein n=1 Tax=Roseovarius atlanticus TaxID=1641875 RepID=A0A0T5NXM9_9RHOB|nr:PDZ domain-containing protein [Roseovarius atlanticus]KRS13526.1 hypothetical protein XM53_06640 [Roseovarius atlanticus]